MSDYLNVLPLALLTRMVRTNDTLMALVPLLEDPPWVRRRNKKTEKSIGNVWTAVEPRDRLRLTQHDAQVRSKLASLSGCESLYTHAAFSTFFWQNVQNALQLVAAAHV